MGRPCPHRSIQVPQASIHSHGNGIRKNRSGKRTRMAAYTYWTLELWPTLNGGRGSTSWYIVGSFLASFRTTSLRTAPHIINLPEGACWSASLCTKALTRSCARLTAWSVRWVSRKVLSVSQGRSCRVTSCSTRPVPSIPLTQGPRLRCFLYESLRWQS
jgi:hypothetical protein